MNLSRLKSFKLSVCAALLMGAGTTSAALFDRGGGLLYDDVLGVTWLQDANYAKTSGYNADGLMNWTQATSWAAGLVYGGFDDWRLARNTPVNGTSWNYTYSYDGTTDLGANITSPNSELSYMYHVNLGLKGYLSPSGAYQPDHGIHGDGTWATQADVGLVHNIQPYLYWSGTEVPGDRAWSFDAGPHSSNGRQRDYLKVHTFHAWAVRDGDVASPVPEPETWALMLAGLGLLGWVGRRRKQQATHIRGVNSEPVNKVGDDHE